MGRPADWAPLGCASDPVPGDPGAVSTEAAHLAAVARQVSGQVTALRRIAATAAGGSLRGVFAARAGACAAGVAGQLAQVAGRYEKASAALAAWAPELEHAQAVSLRALNMAEAPYRTLQTLSPPQVPASGTLTTAQEQDQQTFRRLTGRAQSALDAARALLAQAVKDRDAAAARCATAIRAASDDAIADYWVFGGAFPASRQAGVLLEEAAAGNTRALAELLALERAHGSQGLAQAVSTWWRMLPAARQRQLIGAAPAVVGWLDGLPAPARDQANRKVFWSTYARLTAEAAKLTAELAGASSGVLGVPVLGSLINDADGTAARQAQLAQIEGLLNGMNAIKAVLGQPGQGQDGLPPVYLLGFDAGGLGHTIVSIGDPDTASNVVTYVPGLGSGFGSARGDLSRASLLWRQATIDDPAAKTASVYWLGYDAPQLDLKLSPSSLSTLSLAEDAQTAFTADATAAAPKLADFAAGLAAAHDPSFAAHTVMLGHSYGSLVVGEAAVRAPGKLADDLAFVGSPGVGVNKAADLGVPASHVFAGAAANDPVPDLPPADPADWLNGSSYSHFGINPASPQFGGQDIYVDPGRMVTPLDPIGAHSQYWDRNSASLKNLARIVDAQYGQIQLAPPPQVPQPGDPGAGMPGTPYP